MTAALLGLGIAQPAAALSQDAALEMALVRCAPEPRHARLLPALYRRTGVEQRRAAAMADDRTAPPTSAAAPRPAPRAAHADRHYPFYPIPAADHDRGPTTAARMQRYADAAGPLAARAARHALADANVDPDAVTHLVSCSCTGFHAPGVDIALVKALGLPPTVSRTHIGFMGCHGAFNALAIARQAVEADPDATVLVVAVELCSLHFSYGFDPQQVVANALFADGAGAAIVADQHSEANGKPRPRLAASASRLFDASDDAMTWTIGDHGFRMTLAATVPGLVEAQLRPWLEPWLDEHDLAIDAVGGWAIHPGGPRVIQAVANALDLHENATAISRAVLREAGNMSSATVLFILQRMLRDDRTQRPIVALGFGPGLVGEAMLLR